MDILKVQHNLLAKNLTFLDPPFLKFQKRTDITISKSGFKEIINIQKCRSSTKVDHCELSTINALEMANT